jgi:hypothetical protein
MGEVVRGTRAEDGAAVAIKRLLDEREAPRFEIEARLLARLQHPRVVRVLDHFREGTAYYLVMDLVEGEDLRAHLGRHGRPGLPVDDAVRMAREACEAVAYVNAQHVVHRDVKPHNLILGADGVVLVDFGVAREVQETVAGTVIGTPAFMAPEMIAGGVVSPRADVYGLAATLWMLLTSRPPRIDEPLDLEALVPGVPSSVVAALRAGMATDPAARLPSAEALAQALGGSVDAGSGRSLARTVDEPRLPAATLASVARSVASLLGATAVSLAFADPETGELVYEAVWGAGADEVLGMRLAPGVGVAGAVFTSGQPAAVPDCRADRRFATAVAVQTGYVPHSMLTVPLRGAGLPPGVMQALDRHDAQPYTEADLAAGMAAAELVRLALSGIDDARTVVPGAGA